MQTKKSSNYQELKKSICKNYLKDTCPYGKECKFRHPAKQHDREPEVCIYFLQNGCKRGSECPFLHKKPHYTKETEVCKYFLQNKCKRGDECPFSHRKPKPEKKQRTDWLTFCPYFSNGQCKNKECRFLHITEEDKEVFRTAGKISPRLLEQAKCKALLQEVTVDGNTPTCKDYLQGCCEWMSCPMLHLTRQEFSQEILGLLIEKFKAVLGPHEGYHMHPKNTYNSGARYQEPSEYNVSPGFQGDFGRESYVPVADEPYGMGYGKKSGWHSGKGEYDQQDFVPLETDRIIKGIYHLMKRDTTLIRNPEKEEITDLRGKLNKLAEENARYRFEFSRMHPHDGDGYQPLIPTVPGTDDYKYQDVVRRLERENLDMRRKLSRFQGREQNSYYSGDYDMQQENPMRGGGRGGPNHRGFDRRAYGLPKPVPSHASSYNPLKQKVNSHIRQNMLQQYKKPQQVKQGAPQYGAPQYGKVNYQKYPKPASKKYPQQSQKAQWNSKGNQKKKDQGHSLNQENSAKVESTEGDGDSDIDAEPPTLESGEESNDRDVKSQNEKVEGSSEGDSRAHESTTEENEDETTTTGQDDSKRENEDEDSKDEENSKDIIEDTKEDPVDEHEEHTNESTESETTSEVTTSESTDVETNKQEVQGEDNEEKERKPTVEQEELDEEKEQKPTTEQEQLDTEEK